MSVFVSVSLPVSLSVYVSMPAAMPVSVPVPVLCFMPILFCVPSCSRSGSAAHRNCNDQIVHLHLALGRSILVQQKLPSMQFEYCIPYAS